MVRRGEGMWGLGQGLDEDRSIVRRMGAAARWLVSVDPTASQLCDLGQVPSLLCVSISSSENKDINSTYNTELF